jgi:flagellin
MLSVNTNYSAMVALQNLNLTNSQLEGVQNRISTGMKVANAKDNGAVFAIAEGQRARVSAVSAVQDGISRASSTIDVALSAGEKIGKVIQELKAKAVSAQANDLTTEQRAALQSDFAALRSQIDSIANSAQFNGANLIKGTGNDLNVLISDLGGTTAATGLGVQTAAMTNPLSGSALVTAAGANIAATDTITLTLSDTAGGSSNSLAVNVEITNTMTIDDYVNAVNSASGGKVSASYDEANGRFTYLINDDAYDTLAVASDNAGGAAAALGEGVASATVTSAGNNVYNVTGRDWSMAGAMFATFASADISTSTAAATTAANQLEQALTDLNEQMASMGSQSKALDIQATFLSSLSDSIEAGIGNLVDADLAKESARLQSLQIKQQLGAQALSIANQSPSIIMNLFRG